MAAIWLFLRRPAQGEQSSARSRSAAQRISTLAALRSQPQARRVLIIEGDPDAGEFLRAAVESLGHTALVAHSGPEAIDFACRFKPNVVLCNTALPGLDGYQVARRLRRDPILRDTIIIALSCSGAAKDQRRAAAAGFDALLSGRLNMAALEIGLQARRHPSSAPASTPVKVELISSCQHDTAPRSPPAGPIDISGPAEAPHLSTQSTRTKTGGVESPTVDAESESPALQRTSTHKTWSAGDHDSIEKCAVCAGRGRIVVRMTGLNTDGEAHCVACRGYGWVKRQC
jgi:CheY-like chemotaxis protein